MRKSKYLIINSFYFDFNNDLTDIINVKESFKNQNILDLFRFDKITIIKKINYENNINFIYLPQSIEIIDDESFESNQIKILDLSNCIKLKYIGVNAFNSNQIKQLKLPKNIETLSFASFAYNKIQNLDLSNCIKLKNIEEYAFKENQIKILDLSNCIKLKNIREAAFRENQIKHLKLPKNVETLSFASFAYNKIQNLDLSNCIKLKLIVSNAFAENPLNEIKILDNINVGTSYSPSFETDKWNTFTKYYNDNNKKAGDYKLENNKWQWYPL